MTAPQPEVATMDPANPYAPPETPIEPAVGPAARRSRWLPLRWLPVAFLGASAACSWLVAALVAAAEVLWAARTRAGGTPIRPPVGLSAGITGGLLAYGILSLVAARSWHAGRWKRAVALTLVWYGAGTTAAMLLGPAR